ncbi:MAG: hypothetical protein AAF349_19625 [Cyanobacteria bacterium P01_A01_bin.68]
MRGLKFFGISFTLATILCYPAKAQDTNALINDINQKVEQIDKKVTAQNSANDSNYNQISETLSQIEKRLKKLESKDAIPQLEQDKLDQIIESNNLDKAEFKEIKAQNSFDNATSVWQLVLTALGFLVTISGIVAASKRLDKQIKAEEINRYGDWKALLKQNLIAEIYDSQDGNPDVEKAKNIWKLYRNLELNVLKEIRPLFVEIGIEFQDKNNPKDERYYSIKE